MAPEHLSEGGSLAPIPTGGRKKTQVQIQHDLGEQEGTAEGVDFSCYITEGAALATSARVGDDGRIVLTLKEKTSLPKLPYEEPPAVPEFATDDTRPLKVPALSVLITITGSRGDVQPFIPIAHRLQKAGHRVRIGTHSTFAEFVKEQGIEFFDIGGDPEDLMSYMTKNPGLIPGISSLTNGDIPRKRKMIGEILQGCWKACYEPDPDSGELFAADVIISNPPCFAHIHCAEALNIPLHVIFTMPWCSTQAFPHPLVNISQSNAEPGMTNYLSYALVDLLSWQGLGDVINTFRKTTLGLPALTLRSGPLILERLHIPTTFMWSPALIPKPKDWGSHIDVTGFTFLESGPDFKPDDKLKAFLDAGDDPVYIGFGSVPVDDPKAMTQILFDAVKAAGVRALISSGWAKLGEGVETPDQVHILGNCPHDWLFKHVKAAVHHGGAGTTAIAVKEGRPNLVVPFFGDQPFWGEMISKAGAGPDPIPHKELTVENLTEALKFLIKPETLKAAQELGAKIREEDGVEKALNSFEAHLPLLNMRCDADSSKAACWWSPEHFVKLSPFAAQVLADEGKLDLTKLLPHRVKNYATRADITDPLTGGGMAIFKTVIDYYSGLGQILVNPKKGGVATVTAIPLGLCNIVSSTGEGFRNLPHLWGGETRPVGEINNFSDGVKEAGKGFYYGYQDAIGGVFTEPYKGAKKEGGLGFLKGAARGIGNAMVKPASGGLGLVEHTAKGAWASLNKSSGKQIERVAATASTRRVQGVEAAKAASSEERQAVLDRWEVLLQEQDSRKEEMEQEVKKWSADLDQAGAEGAKIKKSVVESEEIKGGVRAKSTGEVPEGSKKQQQVPPREETAEEAAERRGYERAKAEMKAQQPRPT